MKKSLVLIIAMLMASTQAFASMQGQGKVEQMWATPNTTAPGTGTNMVQGTGATIVTRSFNVSSVKNMGIWWRLNEKVPATPSHTSTSNVALYMEASYDDTSANYATVTTLTRNVNTVSTVDTVTYPNMKYVRFRATGLTGQGTDSTITAYLFTQE